MPFRRLLLAVFALAPAACLLFGSVIAADAQSFSTDQRKEIEEIVRSYLLRNPEVLQDVMLELEKRQSAAEAEKAKAAVKGNATLLFDSPRHVVVGNPKGDVTLIEFFDYNCGFCKRALADLVDLMKGDPNLRVVLKEFPVLGEGSVEAAKVAIAAHMQDKSGKKYFDFHQKLLGSRGPVDKARALAVAKELGFDVARIEGAIARVMLTMFAARSPAEPPVPPTHTACGELAPGYFAVRTWSIARAINSSMVRRIWWSDCSTPLASKSLRIFKKTSSSPGDSRSETTTSLA